MHYSACRPKLAFGPELAKRTVFAAGGSVVLNYVRESACVVSHSNLVNGVAACVDPVAAPVIKIVQLRRARCLWTSKSSWPPLAHDLLRSSLQMARALPHAIIWPGDSRGSCALVEPDHGLAVESIRI